MALVRITPKPSQSWQGSHPIKHEPLIGLDWIGPIRTDRTTYKIQDVVALFPLASYTFGGSFDWVALIVDLKVYVRFPNVVV